MNSERPWRIDMTLAQVKREIESAEWAVREAENRIEDLRRPEEEYESALAEYRAEAERYTDRTIAAQMELDELHATLKKPWWEYADSKNGVRRRKQHPVAQRCAELASLLEPSWSLDYAKRELERRKDVLDNFSGYMAGAERDLIAAHENLHNLRQLSIRVTNRMALKKPRARKAIPDIRFTEDGPDYILDSEDIRAAFKAGMRLSIIAGDVFYSIKREWLRPVLSTVDAFTVHVNGCVEIRWDTGYLKFKPSDMVMAKWFDPLLDLNRGRRIEYDANDNPIWED
jgi:hypothetical protein